MNTTTQSGRLTKDAEVKVTNSGKSIAFFTLAFDTPKKDEYGNWTKESNFIDCKYFKGYRVDDLKKGAAIAIQGSLKQESWEKEGKKSSKIVIMVDDIFFAEKSGHTKENKPGAPASESAGESADVPF